MTRNQRKDRLGVAAVEAALVLPPIVIFVLTLTALGLRLNKYQGLQNSAQQGARAAVSAGHTNSDVQAAVMAALPPEVEAEDISVSISKLNEDGTVEYEVQNLNENEEGSLIKVTVELNQDGGSYAYGSLNSSAIVRREHPE